MNIFMVQEAIASTALSHEDGCTCDACLAAGGDKDAFARVLYDLTVGGEEPTSETREEE